MKYSYINPRKKSIFTAEMQLFSAFFGITIIMLVLTYSFLLFKEYRFTQEKIDILEKRALASQEIEEIEKEINFINKENTLSENIFTKNTVLKDSISNMFDLVPARITLSEANLLENGLILYGITPTKDIYNFMLQAPLRSIFHRTYSSFYPVKNGWLRFVSTNYIDKKEDTTPQKEEEELEYEDEY